MEALLYAHDTGLLSQHTLEVLAAGAADEDTLWVVSHFSHNGGWLHDQLREMAEK